MEGPLPSSESRHDKYIHVGGVEKENCGIEQWLLDSGVEESDMYRLQSREFSIDVLLL